MVAWGHGVIRYHAIVRHTIEGSAKVNPSGYSFTPARIPTIATVKGVTFHS